MPRVLGLLPAPVKAGRNDESRLPIAALEFESPSAAIIATPVPRLTRSTILFVFLLVLALIASAAVIRIDRIVSARGKLVADAPNIVMQAFDQTIIQSIEVKKGDIVRKGQVLARLNPTFTGADHASIKDQVDLLGARAQRLLATASGATYQPDAANAHAALQGTISDQQAAEFAASIQNYDKKIDQLRTQIAGDKAQAEYFGQRLVVASDVEEMRKKLQQMQTGSLLYTLQATDIRLTMAASLSKSESDAAQGDRQLAALEAERTTFIEQWNGRNSQDLAETQGKLTLARQELAKAELHNELVVLTAPRDSIVLSVAKISVGSVVTSAEPLIQLVPIDAPLSVEADISGMESGHVSPGDAVTVKFDTLPFLQYGSGQGIVRAISPDSFSPETSVGDGGSSMPNRPNTLYYRADISLDSLMMHDTPAGFRPMPGMPITADVKVGTRSVLSYFADKILPVAYGSLREP
ncbi:HlyD family secretion protein [Rhodoligotrophos appendicifer]|uniref:HlyD family type I secretion periplasmic adaptor subunit n=1 Tax=Rhodoligotrophos appendicifer TaxID=987056 RepID=UPI0011863DE1|nr:HlyD family type I secretion periplasmic adaptor subunit [Rhodoligotrophos appendicifer]